MNLPQDTQDDFRQKDNKSDNLGLWLDRFADPGMEGKQKLQFFQSLQSVLCSSPYIYSSSQSQGLITAFYQRSLAIANSLPHAKTFTASPEWRMVVGLGQSSILETAMTLDRITGIPLIPGSALKGLAASYAMLCELNTTERQVAEQNSDFVAIFGNQNQAGKVIFLDAVPKEAPTLETDIVNCHYPDYYSGKTPTPTPYQSPIPVYFLTLGHKSKFAFAVAGRDHNDATRELVEKAEEWLKDGLQELGIGAKTAAGYGYLEVNES